MTPSDPAKKLVRNTYSCPKRWHEFAGDDFVRTCTGCNHHVFNLTGLSEEEVLQFITAQDGEVCAMVHVDKDGYVVNGRCEDRSREHLTVVGSVAAVPPPSPEQVIARKIAHTKQRLDGLRRLAELLGAKVTPPTTKR